MTADTIAAAGPICRDEKTTKGCCAVGFYFARHIQQQGIDVPQGILWQAWAGSIIQEWIPRHGFRLEPQLKPLADRVDVYYPNTPLGRAVWKKRLGEIERWLAEAEKAMAENTPFPYPQPLMPEPGPRGLRGFYNGKIHPIVPMAIRGVVWYQGESDFRNRLWDIEMKVMARTWRDLFSVAGDGREIPFYWMQLLRIGQKDGLKPPRLTDAKELPNVEVAGKDKRWHKAVAKIEGDKLLARSDKVDKPTHVRYCYTNIPPRHSCTTAPAGA